MTDIAELVMRIRADLGQNAEDALEAARALEQQAEEIAELREKLGLADTMNMEAIGTIDQLRLDVARLEGELAWFREHVNEGALRQHIAEVAQPPKPAPCPHCGNDGGQSHLDAVMCFACGRCRDEKP